jgi:hypothetical protein
MKLVLVRDFCNFIQWRVFFNSLDDYDELISVPNHRGTGSLTLSIVKNRKATDEVGCPVFDY